MSQRSFPVGVCHAGLTKPCRFQRRRVATWTPMAAAASELPTNFAGSIARPPGAGLSLCVSSMSFVAPRLPKA